MADKHDDDALLEDWSARLKAELDLDVAVDINSILGLAGRAAHAVVRPAAPLTTFIVGYAAGLAAASGTSPEDAISEATEVAMRLCRAQASPAS